MENSINITKWLSDNPTAVYGEAPFGFSMVYRGGYRVYDADGNVVDSVMETYTGNWEQF